MERFRIVRTAPSTSNTRTRTGTVTVTAHGRKASEGGRKRPSIGRAAESFSSKLIALLESVRRRDGAQDKTSAFLKALFRLPREIHIAILRELSISDLLSLRLTSHSLHSLITSCGPALVRQFIKHRFGSLHVKLYPPPGPDCASLQYLLAMRRRHIASVRLTRELTNHILRDEVKVEDRNGYVEGEGSGCDKGERKRQMTWTSVYEKLLPLVFAVGYFLEEHRRIVLERDLGRLRKGWHVGYDISTTAGITDAESDIFKRLDQPLRLQYFYMYCFILQVLVRKLRSPSCPVRAGFEGLVRGWSGHGVCNEDIAFVLVLGGINQVSKLLACKSYSERRRLLHTFITRLSPHESVAWRRHWRDLGVSSPALLDDIPCASIGVTQLDQIFEPLMARMMGPGSREFTEHEKLRYEEVRREKNYVNELMGYDILRRRPAHGEDSDVEEEDDDEMYM